MKIPRDVSASQLIQALSHLEYTVTQQRGSHIRVTTMQDGEHHEVIPNHNPIKVGTLHNILKSIARDHHMTIDELIKKLDL